MNATLHDVVIYSKTTKEVVAVVGLRLPRWDGKKGSGRGTADHRLATAGGRINDRFGATIVPTGKYTEGSTLEEADL